MKVSEIYGYELQAKNSEGVVIYQKIIHSGMARATIIDIPDPSLVAEYNIAVLDRQGLYSVFVPIVPTDPSTEVNITPEPVQKPKQLR